MSRFVRVSCGDDDSSDPEEPISEAYVSFSESDNELKLQKLLDSESVDFQWCSNVDKLLRQQPTTTNWHDWLGISLRLVEIIQKFAESDVSSPLSSPDDRRDLSLVLKTVPKPPVDFRLGMRLLETTMGEPVSPEEELVIKELEQEAEIMKMQLTQKDEEIDILQQRLCHWRNIAKLRLVELKKEFEMRERLIFGNNKLN